MFSRHQGSSSSSLMSLGQLVQAGVYGTALRLVLAGLPLEHPSVDQLRFWGRSNLDDGSSACALWS